MMLTSVVAVGGVKVGLFNWLTAPHGPSGEIRQIEVG